MGRSIRSVSFLPPLCGVRQCAFVAAFALFASACGVIDYDIGPSRQNLTARPDKKHLGNVYLHFSDSAEPTRIEIRRVRGGYALQSSLYESDSGEVHFTTSHTKSQKGFVGIEGKFSF